jgi:HK97 family phage portal protein
VRTRRAPPTRRKGHAASSTLNRRPASPPKRQLFYQAFAEQFSGYQYQLGTDQESFDTLLKKYGRSTPWVYVAINRIANAAAQIPLQIINSNRKGTPGALVKTRVSGLRDLLQRPNPHQSYYDFVESAFVSLETTGNLFILKDERSATNKRPKKLYILDPSRMKVIPDAKNLVKEYSYRANLKGKTYQLDEIIHVKYANSYHAHLGLAPLTAARMAVQTDVDAVGWNRQFLENGAWPAGALETPNDLSKETLLRLRREIKKIVQGGKKSVAQVLLLTGGLKYNKMALTPKEMDWADSRRMSRDEILAVFGVPFAVAGLFSQESTTARSAGVAQQVKNFYLFTVFPKMLKLAAALTHGLATLYRDDLELIPNLTSVPALADDVQKELMRAQTFRVLVASGWPPNAALGEHYPHVSKFPHGDVAWLNSAMVPISGPTSPTTEGATDEPPTENQIRALTGINGQLAPALVRIFTRHQARLVTGASGSVH